MGITFLRRVWFWLRRPRLESLLFGLAARDLLTQACAVLLIVAVTVAAALLPARRAAHIDPLVALRNE